MGQQFALASQNEKGDNPFQEYLEIGKVTFSTTDSQATYRTTLLTIKSAAASLNGAVSAATDAAANDVVSIPTGAVSSGSITVTRSSKGTSGATYNVILVGNKYTAAP